MRSWNEYRKAIKAYFRDERAFMARYERLVAMADILNRVPHDEFWNSVAACHDCHEDCPRCAWDKLYKEELR